MVDNIAFDKYLDLMKSRDFQLVFSVIDNLLYLSDTAIDLEKIKANVQKHETHEWGKTTYSFWIEPNNYMQQNVLVAWSSFPKDIMFVDEVFPLCEKSNWLACNHRTYWDMEKETMAGNLAKDDTKYMGGNMLLYTHKTFEQFDLIFGRCDDNANVQCGRWIGKDNLYNNYVFFNMAGLRYVPILLSFLNKFKFDDNIATE